MSPRWTPMERGLARSLAGAAWLDAKRALYLLDRQGDLVAVVDPTRPDLADMKQRAADAGMSVARWDGAAL